MYSSRLRVFTQLAFVAVLVFMLAAVPAALADSRPRAARLARTGCRGRRPNRLLPPSQAGRWRWTRRPSSTTRLQARLPPSLASLGFQATQTSEFGD